MVTNYQTEPTIRAGAELNYSPPDVVYLCDWLPPDFGAVGQYALKAARELARAGIRVTLYGLSSQGTSIADDGLLRVVRIRAPAYDKTSFRARAWWTLRTNLSIVRHAWRDLRTSREIIFTGSPPFMLHVLGPLNLFLGKTLTYRITDFFPECLIAASERTSFALALLYRLTLFWRRRVSRFEVLGEDQRRRLLDIGIPEDRIVLKRDSSPIVIPSGAAPAKRPSQLDGLKILLYSGNFGVAHDELTFLEAYRRHHSEGSRRVGFWLNATGTRAESLTAALRECGLPYVRTDPVPLDDLPALLLAADSHLITLRKQFWGYVLPSKVYACLDSGRSILYIGPRESDVHLLCSQRLPAAAYWQAEPGDVEAVYRFLEAM